jgi:hypothetical protein
VGGQGFGFDEDGVSGLGAAGGGSKQGQSEEGKYAGRHGGIRWLGGRGVPDRIGDGGRKGEG